MFSNYPQGFSDGVTIQNVSVSINNPSTTYWVGNNPVLINGEKQASDSNNGSFLQPFLTINGALTFINNAASSYGVGNNIIINVREGYTQTITSAGGITLSTAGIQIIGIGEGDNRPKLTFSTAVSASILVTGANVSIKNIIGIAGINALTQPFDIRASGFNGSIEWRDGSSSVEAVRAVLTNASADNLNLYLKYIGFTAGSSCVNAIRLVGTDNAKLTLDFFGKASTSVVQFITTACSNIEIGGYMFNSGTTDGSKDIIDTVTGSTWFGYVYDGSAGQAFAGGSAAAWGPANASTIVADLSVPTADSTANILERDVIGNKTDAAVTTVGTTNSIAAYTKGLVGGIAVPSANSTANVLERDVLGNKTDTPIYVPGTTNSNSAYIKGSSDLQEKIVVSSAATMVNNSTIFTITGGAVKIEALFSECVTNNDATASTLQYSITPTVGSAQTISGASASLANATAGASVTLAGTALSTAALFNNNGPNLIANPGTILCPAGTIKIVIGTGSTTGTWKHHLRYRPLDFGVTATAS